MGGVQFTMNEQACAFALYTAKWPGGFICPRCGYSRAYTISTRRLPLFECQNCHFQTSLTAGTVMQGSRTPLSSWFQAIKLHASPNSVNAAQLATIIGVTYKTAWLICHKIRHAMSQTESRDKLTGLVRVSDSAMFLRFTGMTSWHRQEQSILIGASERPAGTFNRIKIQKQNKQSLRTRYSVPDLSSFIRTQVSLESARSVIQSGRITPHRNPKLIQIGRDAEQALARRFRGIGPKYLQVYLDQFCYERNRSKMRIFQQLLIDCAQTPAITLPILTRAELSICPPRFPPSQAKWRRFGSSRMSS
jgi:transposase-like protein